MKIPYTYAAPCVKPFTGDNGGATADGVTADSIKVVVYIGDPAKNPLQSATVTGAGADVEPRDREGDVQGLRRPVREVLRDSTAARSTS